MAALKLPTPARLYIKRTPWLYNIAKRLTDPRAPRLLCNATSDLCIDGYQSSGNSFSVALLHVANSQLRIARHCHSFANLQMALNYGIPAVCLVRHPDDCIPSRVARFKITLDHAVFDYLDFYRLAQRQLDRLIVVTFDELTKDTGRFLTRMADATGQPIPLDDLDSMQEEAMRRMRAHAKKKGKPQRVSLPYGPREEEKGLIRERFRSSPHHAEACALWGAVAGEPRAA